MRLLNTLISFSRERFPARVTVPLAFILFGAPASVVRLDPYRYITGLITVFLGLLTLRIVDDIADIEKDAVTNPERGIVCGKIDVAKLKTACFTCTTLIAVLNISRPFTILIILVTAGSYVIFYGIKYKVPIMLHPLLVNMVFFIIPVYASSLKNFYRISTISLLSIFIWLGVIAHDYAHSVHGTDEGFAGIEGFSDCIGPKNSAILSTFLFACSAIAGIAFWYQSGAGPLFLITLCCTCALIGFRCMELIKDPKKATARRFYVAGFVFFLIPLSAIIAETIINSGHA